MPKERRKLLSDESTLGPVASDARVIDTPGTNKIVAGSHGMTD